MGQYQYIILLGILIANNIITSFNSFSAHRWITENPPYELMCSSLRTDKTLLLSVSVFGAPVGFGLPRRTVDTKWR